MTGGIFSVLEVFLSKVEGPLAVSYCHRMGAKTLENMTHQLACNIL